MAYDYDFIGFTYNGKHSIDYFGIYRTSDGSRYNDNLVPQMNDKTADIPGGDGQYYFSTHHKTRQFSIPIAFDNLTESKYREMRQWLDGKGIYDLIFDEAPYKAYSAKVTGTPQLKTICFSTNGERIYKGEGTIQFTCYYPYAHSIETTKAREDAYSGNSTIRWEEFDCDLMLFKNQTIYDANGNPDWKLQGLKKDGTPINGTFGNFENPYTATEDMRITKIIPRNTTNYSAKVQLSNGKQYIFTKAGCFERYTPKSNTQPIEEPAPKEYILDGKDINDYSLKDYPNKWEWAEASGLLDGLNKNVGDVPVPFVVTKSQVTEGTVFKVGSCEITIKETCTNLKWDSKTGLVTEKVSGEDTERLIHYTGTSYGTIPVGPITNLELNGATLSYNYLYY